MKRILAIITGSIILHIAYDAQYSIYKTKFDYRTYSFKMRDPYKPSQMSLSSAPIPGLGQLIKRESMRGSGFLGGSIALAVFKKIVIWKTDTSWTAKYDLTARTIKVIHWRVAVHNIVVNKTK